MKIINSYVNGYFNILMQLNELSEIISVNTCYVSIFASFLSLMKSSNNQRLL